MSSGRFCGRLGRNRDRFRWNSGICRLWHFETLNFALCRGIRYISTHDLLFIDEDCGIDRVCGAGEITDLVDIAHRILARQLA